MEDMCGGNHPMSNTVSVLWVDDANQSENAKNLESDSMKCECIRPFELEKQLKENNLKNGLIPDLFLVDFYLGERDDPDINEKYPFHGPAVAALIRDRFPEHPIYLVSFHTANGEVKLSQWAQAAENVADQILNTEFILREGKETLYRDSLDYKTLRALRDDTERGNVDTLLDLLKVPDSNKERIKLILPDELKTGLMRQSENNPDGNAISFARWLRGSFLSYPGPLYDQQHTATLLGVNDKGFKKISNKFEKALYNGIFSRESAPRWWVSEVNDLVFALDGAQDIKSSDPWIISTKIFNVPETEMSRCAVCNEFFPETIGRNMDNPNENLPVHFKCSKPDNTIRRPLYFDNPRMFKKD